MNAHHPRDDRLPNSLLAGRVWADEGAKGTVMNANHPSLHVHPLIGEVFELLHRMELCQSEPFVWMAREAIQKLQKYEEAQRARTQTCRQD